jgi:hypothetical protein
MPRNMMSVASMIEAFDGLLNRGMRKTGCLFAEHSAREL